jgi:hypothetical protein
LKRFAKHAVAAALLFLAGCAGGDGNTGATVPADEVEVALYVAIQDGNVAVRRGPAERGRPALDTLYEIACRRTQLDTWDCRVVLPDGSTVVCSVDRVARVGDTVAVDGRPRCKY